MNSGCHLTDPNAVGVPFVAGVGEPDRRRGLLVPNVPGPVLVLSRSGVPVARRPQCPRPVTAGGIVCLRSLRASIRCFRRPRRRQDGTDVPCCAGPLLQRGIGSGGEGILSP